MEWWLGLPGWCMDDVASESADVDSTRRMWDGHQRIYSFKIQLTEGTVLWTSKHSANSLGSVLDNIVGENV